MRILTDEDLQNIDILFAAKVLHKFLVQVLDHEVNSPARTNIPLGKENITFTAGADAKDFGFRAYAYRSGLRRDKEDQIVVCWDRKSHDLKAIAIGEALGAWRTGILGGIAFQALAGPNTETCGVIGTGSQAYTHVRAIAALAKPTKFLVFSRDPQRRSDFAHALERDTDISTMSVEGAKDLVLQSDALIVATNAPEPVFELTWLDRCKHVTTVGPKARDRHETPTDIAKWAERIMSDSPQQIRKQGDNHFLADWMVGQKIEPIGQQLANGNTNIFQRRTLYLSAGLSGTEVALLGSLAG